MSDWKQWPGYNPVGEMIREQLYLIKLHSLDKTDTYLLKFLGERPLSNGRSEYHFLRVADTHHPDSFTFSEFCSTTEPERWMIREVSISELSLFVSYNHKYPLFERLLKGEE